MNLNDRMTRGFVSGVLAGITTLIPDLIFYQVGINKTRYLDWASAVIYGRQPYTTTEAFWAEVGHLFFDGLLGIIFVYLISKLWTSTNYLFKGWFYAVFMWFALHAYAISFRLSGLTNISLGSTISNFIGASVYGLVLAFVSTWIYEREKITRE